MCGIVGYKGELDPVEVIMKGLKTLEYRGYDSAGLTVFNKGDLVRVRAQGKLKNLEEKLSSYEFDGHVGIGHTRWATHGAPVEKNAHPHSVDGVSIVHNGIIENYAELKKEVLAYGGVLSSDTDSELVAHLIAKEYKACGEIFQATKNIVPRLTGAYSILVISQSSPDQMVAFKNGPPLILSQDDKGFIVASDILAIVPYSKKVLYLADHQMADIENDQWVVRDKDGNILKNEWEEVSWNAESAEKQGYPHFMLKEIFEQPRAVAASLEPHIDLATQTVRLSQVGFGLAFDQLKNLSETSNFAGDLKATHQIMQGVQRVFIVACGTSYYSGMVGKYLIEEMAKVPVEVDIASEFRYRRPIIPKDSLFIVISQSGETADSLAALRQVKSEGVRTLSICNVRASSIDREADGHLYMNSGVEIGVASTKAFVSSLAILNLIAIDLAKAKGALKREAEVELVEALLGAPSLMEQVLNHDKFFDTAAHTLKKFRGFLYMGRGVSFPLALEGALKLKELAYLHAEGYAAGEMKHGPLALIDETMSIVMLAPKDDVYEKTLSNLEEAKARGGQIISIGSGIDDRLKDLSEHYLSLPNALWNVNPLLEVIPLQLMAYHLADTLGLDVDQPRNLAKSVTVE